jgi:DNA polymerase III gamma/tau subunit
MFKTLDRPQRIGLCVIAMLVAVTLLLMQISRHRGDAPWWSQEPRAAVSTGAVREEAPRAAATPGDSPVSAPVENAIDNQVSVDAKPQDRIDSSAIKPRLQKRAAEKARPAHGVTARRKSSVTPQTSQATFDDDKQISSRAPADAYAPKPTPVTKPETQLSPDALPAMPRETTSQPTAQTNGSSEPAINPTISQPKTRQEVQDELRRARMNGSLPRFGNPDPYGPGGSPSTGND